MLAKADRSHRAAGKLAVDTSEERREKSTCKKRCKQLIWSILKQRGLLRYDPNVPTSSHLLAFDLASGYGTCAVWMTVKRSSIAASFVLQCP